MPSPYFHAILSQNDSHPKLPLEPRQFHLKMQLSIRNHIGCTCRSNPFGSVTRLSRSNACYRLFGAASSPLCKFRTPSVRRLFGIGVMLRPRYVRTIRDRPVSPRHSPHHAQSYDILHLHRKTFKWCERCGRVFYSLHKVIGHVLTKPCQARTNGRWLVNQPLQTPFLQSGDKSGENCSPRPRPETSNIHPR